MKKTFNKTPIIYKSYNDRVPDEQYKNLFSEILNNGLKKTTIHSTLPENKGSGHSYCLEIPGFYLKYDLSNGVPVYPIRDLTKYDLPHGAIGEIVAFIHGAETLEEMIAYGCLKSFWERWVIKEKCENFGLEEGHLGTGSYGPILTNMPTPSGNTFNQIDAVIKQMQEKPFLRTHALTTWYPPLALGDKDQNSPRKVVVAPCHGNFVQFDVYDSRTMHMAVYQRSADVAVGLPLNLTEWVAFGMMIGYFTNLQLKYYSHFLPNPQIYDIQIPAIEKIITRESRPLPMFNLKSLDTINSIYDFRKQNFSLDEYNPHPWIKIPTAV